jgi:carnosine N-methyltransferase
MNNSAELSTSSTAPADLAAVIDLEEVGRVLSAFEQYAKHNVATVIDSRRKFLASISEEELEVLNQLKPTPSEKLNQLTEALEENQKLASAIVEYTKNMLIHAGEFATILAPWPSRQTHKLTRTLGVSTTKLASVYEPTPKDHAIVRSTIRGMYRDWSVEAIEEILACLEPIEVAVKREYSRFNGSENGFEAVAKNGRLAPSPLDFKILVPGAGLCRIAFELCKAGHSIEANEISYHQLLAANFILSRSMPPELVNELPPWQRQDVLAEELATHYRMIPATGVLGELNGNANLPCQFNIHPWCTQFSNHTKASHQLRAHTIPDIFPTTVLKVPPMIDLVSPKQGLSFVANNLTINSKDFLSMYSDSSMAGTYHVLVTCFFIDTAPNVLKYMCSARHVLKPGGLWINIGPYLWNCYENGPGGRREGDAADDDAQQARQVQVEVKANASEEEIWSPTSGRSRWTTMSDPSMAGETQKSGSGTRNQTTSASGGRRRAVSEPVNDKVSLRTDTGEPLNENGDCDQSHTAKGEQQRDSTPDLVNDSGSSRPDTASSSVKTWADVVRGAVNQAQTMMQDSTANHTNGNCTNITNSSLESPAVSVTSSALTTDPHVVRFLGFGSQSDSSSEPSSDHPSSPPGPPPGPNFHPNGPREWDAKLEFSHEEIIRLLGLTGFVVEHQDPCIIPAAGFNLDENSMLQSRYRLAFFQARKP